ncbi:MAG: rhomboid family intramembrane serine protease, partial [Planctomycetota bacterium]
PGHLIGNLLQIYFFGTMVEQIIGTRRFAAVYTGALLAGGLLHLFMQGILEPQSYAVGASGAALGLTITAAVLRPNAMVLLLFIPIALKWLAIGIVALDFYGLVESLRGRGGQVAHWVHLGGAAFGFIAAKKNWIWIDPIEAWQKRKQAAAVEKRQSEDKRMDELLAKISAEGMNSLSRSEKEFLKRVSSRR